MHTQHIDRQALEQAIIPSSFPYLFRRNTLCSAYSSAYWACTKSQYPLKTRMSSWANTAWDMSGYCLMFRAALELRETEGIQIRNMFRINRQSFGGERRMIEMFPLKAIKSWVNRAKSEYCVQCINNFLLGTWNFNVIMRNNSSHSLCTVVLYKKFCHHLSWIVHLARSSYHRANRNDSWMT